MNRRDRERYLTKDQMESLRPLLLAAVARVTLRMSMARARYHGSERDKEVIAECSEGFRYDMNEQVRAVLGASTRRHIP